MHYRFVLGSSQSLLTIIVFAHGLTGIGIFFYLEPWQLKISSLVLIALFAFYDAKHLFQQEIIELAFVSNSIEIKFWRLGQPHFYDKYKVYETRWFAILKVGNKKNSRTLLLNPERFESDRSYRRLRYILRKMEPTNAA